MTVRTTTWIRSSWRQFSSHSKVVHPIRPAASLITKPLTPLTPSIITRPADSFVPTPKRSNSSTPRTRSPHSRNHSEERIVPFTPEQLYRVVANVDEYSEFVPWCTSSRVTRRIDEHHIIADLAVGFRVLSEKYTSVITLKPYRSVCADVPNSSLFDYLITDWTFEPVGDITKLKFYVEFAFRNPMYQRVTNIFFEEVVKQMVGAFENRCVAKYHGAERHGILHRW